MKVTKILLTGGNLFIEGTNLRVFFIFTMTSGDEYGFKVDRSKTNNNHK